jgi:flagellin
MHAGFADELAHVGTLLQHAATGHFAGLDINGDTFVTIVTRFAGDGSPPDTVPGHALADAVIPTISHVPDGNGGLLTVHGTLTLTADPDAAIRDLGDAVDAVSTLRSKLGAVSNRLDHVYNNLSNIASNTQAATGRIMDVDFATESSNMTANQMLMQAGTAMLKQTSSMSSMVMSLLQ